MSKVFEEYIKKRRFDVTPEPVPKSEDTILLSYAIPKAVIPQVGEKVLMVQTEHHPPEYMHFEGEIPREEYGGGIVKIYDKGTFRVVDVNEKRMIVEMKGKKVKGKFAIIFLHDDQYLLVRIE